VGDEAALGRRPYRLLDDTHDMKLFQRSRRSESGPRDDGTASSMLSFRSTSDSDAPSLAPSSSARSSSRLSMTDPAENVARSLLTRSGRALMHHASKLSLSSTMSLDTNTSSEAGDPDAVKGDISYRLKWSRSARSKLVHPPPDVSVGLTVGRRRP